MKKITAFALALLMILSTASYAAPAMTGTVASTLEEEAQVTVETNEETAQTQGEKVTYDATYGTLVYDIDFETDTDFPTTNNADHKVTQQGYANPNFTGYAKWRIQVAAATKISKETETNGNRYVQFTNSTINYPQLKVDSGGTVGSTGFTNELGHFTVMADVKADISGNSGADFNYFNTRTMYGYSYEEASTTKYKTTEETTPSLVYGTTDDSALKNGTWTHYVATMSKTSKNTITYERLTQMLYIFWYKAKPTTVDVDTLCIDNVKLYYKPFSVDVTVAGNEALGIADKTVTVEIGTDLDSTITKAELMEMLTYGDDVILKDLTLADGSAFTEIDVVEVQNVKGVFKKFEWLHDTYGTLLVDIDFETDTAYKSGAAISTQGISNINYDKNGKWTISTGGVSTKEGFAPAKVTENGNTFLRVYNTNNKFPQFKLNGTGKFTDELGYYTYVADVRYNFAENVDRGTDTKGNPITLSGFFIRANYSCKNDSATATGTVQTVIYSDNNLWPDNNVWLKGFTGTANKRTTDIYKDSNKIEYNYDYVQGLIYPFQYSVTPSASSEGSDYFDYDNIKLYFKPFSVKVKVDNEEITVAIPETLDSTFTKAELMSLVPEKKGAILTDLTLADESAFTEIDVMKVKEVKAVWTEKAPVSYNVSSIRVAEPSGVRFKASIAKEFKNEQVEYGFIVTRKVLLGSLDAAEALKFGNEENVTFVTGVSYGYDTKLEKNVDIIFAVDEKNIFFTAAVVGVPNTMEGYTDILVVRPYLKNEAGVYTYGEPVSKSVLETALAIRDKDYVDVDAQGKEYVQNILNVCGEEL